MAKPLISKYSPVVDLFTVFKDDANWSDIPPAKMIKLADYAEIVRALNLTDNEVGELTFILSADDPIAAAKKYRWRTRINRG